MVLSERTTPSPAPLTAAECARHLMTRPHMWRPFIRESTAINGAGSDFNFVICYAPRLNRLTNDTAAAIVSYSRHKRLLLFLAPFAPKCRVNVNVVVAAHYATIGSWGGTLLPAAETSPEDKVTNYLRQLSCAVAAVVSAQVHAGLTGTSQHMVEVFAERFLNNARPWACLPLVVHREQHTRLQASECTPLFLHPATAYVSAGGPQFAEYYAAKGRWLLQVRPAAGKFSVRHPQEWWQSGDLDGTEKIQVDLGLHNKWQTLHASTWAESAYHFPSHDKKATPSMASTVVDDDEDSPSATESVTSVVSEGSAEHYQRGVGRRTKEQDLTVREDLPQDVLEGDEAQYEALQEVQQNFHDQLALSVKNWEGTRDYQDFYHVKLGEATLAWSHLQAVSEAAPWGHIRFRLQGLFAMVHQHHFLASALGVRTQLFEAAIAALPAMIAHVLAPLAHFQSRTWPILAGSGRDHRPPFHSVKYLTKLISEALDEHPCLTAAEFSGPAAPTPIVIEVQKNVAAVPNIPWHLSATGTIKRVRLDSILLALPQACIVHLARHWKAHINASYLGTRSAQTAGDHDHLGAVAKAQFVHGPELCPPQEPFVPTHFMHLPIYDLQLREHKDIEFALRAHVAKNTLIKHEAVGLPEFGRDRPFHGVQFRLTQVQFSKALNGIEFYRQALNFASLPQEVVPPGWAARAASRLCLTAQQYRELLRVAALTDTKRKWGQPQLSSENRASDVTRWLATDLSFSETCKSSGYKHTPFWDLGQ